MYYHVLFGSIVTHPSLNRLIQGHGRGGGWCLGVDPILAHTGQEAVIAWRSPIYHRANTDNHALTFTSPVNFIVSTCLTYSTFCRFRTVENPHGQGENIQSQKTKRLWLVELGLKSWASYGVETTLNNQSKPSQQSIVRVWILPLYGIPKQKNRPPGGQSSMTKDSK